jgi:hypothetical protein
MAAQVGQVAMVATAMEEMEEMAAKVVQGAHWRSLDALN